MFDLLEDDETYLAANDVHGIISRLMQSLLDSKPDNVVDFAINHLVANYPAALVGGNKQHLLDQYTSPPQSPKQTAPVSIFNSSRLHFSMIDESMMEPEESMLIEDSVPMEPMMCAPAAAPGGRGGLFARRASISATPIKVHERRSEPSVTFNKTEEEETRLLRDVLPKLWVTSGLAEPEARKIVLAFEPMTFHEGQEIVKRGQAACSYFVVESGSAEVVGDDEASSSSTYMPGEGFGELALLYNQPYADTIIAAASSSNVTKCWRLDRDTFRLICMKNAMDRRDRRASLVQQVPLLQALTPSDLTALADALQSVTFKRGEEVCVQGQVAREFYIVDQGELEMQLVGGGDVLVKKRSGDFVGEVALLARTGLEYATVRVASEQCTLLSIKRSVFFRTLASAKNVLPALEAQLVPFHSLIVKDGGDKSASAASRNSLKRKLKQASSNEPVI